MGKKKPETVRRAMRKLRADLIDGERWRCPVESRMAYAVECVVRWATEDTVGWASPSEQVRAIAKLLRHEVGLPEPSDD